MEAGVAVKGRSQTTVETADVRVVSRAPWTVCPTHPYLHPCFESETCRHCGTTGFKGEDPTCLCPKHDNDCEEHR